MHRNASGCFPDEANERMFVIGLLLAASLTALAGFSLFSSMSLFSRVKNGLSFVLVFYVLPVALAAGFINGVELGGCG